MPRPSSRDLSAGPRARPSGPGPCRHLIPWTPPPARATAQIPWSRSDGPTGLARRPRRPGLAEPRPRTASGPGQQRRRRAGRGAEGRGAGLGLTLTALPWATRDPAPPPAPPSRSPGSRRLCFLPAAARRPRSDLLLPPLLLPPLPPPQREGALPRPRRERSRRAGARAARALRTAQQAGRRVGKGPGGRGRGCERLHPFPPRTVQQLQPGQFSDVRGSGLLLLSLPS